MVNGVRTSIAIFILAAAVNAVAQPVIIAIPRPGPNAAGWANSPVRIEYICDKTDSCPEPVFLIQDGAQQEVAATVHDANGIEASRRLLVNIDAIPPVVEIQSPISGGVTTRRSSHRRRRLMPCRAFQRYAAACRRRSTRPAPFAASWCQSAASDVVVEVSIPLITADRRAFVSRKPDPSPNCR